ncbi:MAG: RnfABCDGE type electron transport complex subunit B [Prolixibacteraceae bacterium]
MSETLLYTVIVISAIGAVSAVVLYWVSQKFQIFSDPRIDEVEALLPASNCGSCGFPGCRAFAEACVEAESMSHLSCPVGGTETMQAVAHFLGHEASHFKPRTAVLRCNGTCDVRPKTSIYVGVKTCLAVSSLYGGETDCQFGCLGYGDCVPVCQFDSIHMNPLTLLPEVDDDKCNGCGACVDACPKVLFELRRQMPKHRKIFVACRNQDEATIASKACVVACTGCSKCLEICTFDAIEMTKNLAYIDAEKCTLCRKCVSVCQSDTIKEINFPARKIKNEA